MVANVDSKRVQCDEIWSFVYAKQKNVTDEMEDTAGDVRTWTAIDADNKLIISWLAADRDAKTANVFIQDVASRLSNREQLTTDGYKAYLEAVYGAFEDEIDFAQSVKIYGNATDSTSSTEKKYSPAECIGTHKMIVSGNPKEKFISTIYVERQNLTMRMHMRRFTRLTNAFSKKIENHCHAIAFHFVYLQLCKNS